MTTNPTPTQQETLEPCPFCGVTLILLGDYDNEKAWNWYGHPSADNSDCLLSQHRVQTKSDLRTPMTVDRKAWNTRAAVAGPPGDADLISRAAAEAAIKKEHLNNHYGATYRHAVGNIIRILRAMPAATASPTPADVQEVADRVNAGVEQMDRSQKVDAATMRIEFNPTPAESTRVAGEQVTRFKVGDKLRSILASYLPVATVTEITKRGFKYELERPFVISPRLGTQTGGESYDDSQWEIVPSCNAGQGSETPRGWCEDCGSKNIVTVQTFATAEQFIDAYNAAAAPADNNAESKGESDA